MQIQKTQNTNFTRNYSNSRYSSYSKPQHKQYYRDFDSYGSKVNKHHHRKNKNSALSKGLRLAALIAMTCGVACSVTTCSRENNKPKYTFGEHGAIYLKSKEQIESFYENYTNIDYQDIGTYHTCITPFTILDQSLIDPSINMSKFIYLYSDEKPVHEITYPYITKEGLESLERVSQGNLGKEELEKMQTELARVFYTDDNEYVIFVPQKDTKLKYIKAAFGVNDDGFLLDPVNNLEQRGNSTQSGDYNDANVAAGEFLRIRPNKDGSRIGAFDQDDSITYPMAQIIKEYLDKEQEEAEQAVTWINN